MMHLDEIFPLLKLFSDRIFERSKVLVVTHLRTVEH